MKERRLKYVSTAGKDRHGNPRLYFRKRGQAKIRLPGPENSPEFLAAYLAALKGKVSPPKKQPIACTVEDHRGTLKWLFERYYRSPEFAALTPRSQRVRRLILNPWAFPLPLARLTRDHIVDWRNTKEKTPSAANRREKAPGAANNLIKALRVVFAWGIENGLAKENPAKDVPKLTYKPKPFHTWTLAEIRQFERHHAVGTKARLALALLMLTAQRRSDVVNLGPGQVVENRLVFTQAKTGEALELPIIPALRAIINASPTGKVAFLETDQGRPFTANGFGNWFRDRCDEAGLPRCTAHGLRKAAATALAEGGATVPELMSWGGWRSPKQALEYVRAANQRKLAEGSAHLLESLASVPTSSEARRKVGSQSRKDTRIQIVRIKGGGPGRTRTCNQTVMSGRL